MIAFFIFTAFLGFILWGIAYYIAYHTELGMDCITKMKTCCICHERIRNIMDQIKTIDNDYCHSWCEHILEENK